MVDYIGSNTLKSYAGYTRLMRWIVVALFQMVETLYVG